MGTVCSKTNKVFSWIQSILRFQNFMAGDRDYLLVKVKCSGLQCVLEDPRVVVFKGSECPRDVRMYFLELSNLKKLTTAGVRVS